MKVSETTYLCQETRSLGFRAQKMEFPALVARTSVESIHKNTLMRWPWEVDPFLRFDETVSVTEKVQNSGLGPDPDQSVKNGPE